jgi:linoleoyl-CoA desaturase
MIAKTALILAWLAVSYVLLVFFSTSLIMAVLSAYALAQGFVLVGFNIMHDAIHGSYSRNKTVNRILGYTLDLVGGSQMLWRQKHNLLHHTYTNIEPLDDDLQTFGLLRLSPEQRRRPWHRFQHLYAFPLYSFLTLSWVTYADFQKFFSGRIGPYRLPKPKVSDALLFFLTKIFYFTYMLVLPLLFHPLLHVLVTFVAIHLVLGLTLSVVFQLAHAVEGAAFPQPAPDTGHLEREWAAHQVETTVDFAPRNRLATWYLGGLNFQVEHHLFSRICHVHYPRLRPIVEDTCRELGVRYTCYPTVRAALAAHYRFLRALGRRPLQTAPATSPCPAA